MCVGTQDRGQRGGEEMGGPEFRKQLSLCSLGTQEKLIALNSDNLVHLIFNWTWTYLDHGKHPSSVLCDNHLVGESPKLVPQPRVLKLHSRLGLRGHIRAQGRGHVGQEVAGDRHYEVTGDDGEAPDVWQLLSCCDSGLAADYVVTAYYPQLSLLSLRFTTLYLEMFALG